MELEHRRIVFSGHAKRFRYWNANSVTNTGRCRLSAGNPADAIGDRAADRAHAASTGDTAGSDGTGDADAAGVASAERADDPAAGCAASASPRTCCRTAPGHRHARSRVALPVDPGSAAAAAAGRAAGDHDVARSGRACFGPRRPPDAHDRSSAGRRSTAAVAVPAVSRLRRLDGSGRGRLPGRRLGRRCRGRGRDLAPVPTPRLHAGPHPAHGAAGSALACRRDPDASRVALPGEHTVGDSRAPPRAIPAIPRSYHR